jgi:hypothetical protein
VQEFGFRLGQVKPGGPIFRAKHHDLPVVMGNNVRSWSRGQHRERRRMIMAQWGVLQTPRHWSRC